MFVAFEGVDGVGKSTQARLLAEHRRAEGVPVLLVREPGGTELGEDLRRILLTPRDEDLSTEAELCLFMAARAELCQKVIGPAIERGDWVISDRFLWSSVVYQGIVGGIGIDAVLDVGRVATRGIRPTRTVLIDLDPGQAHGALDSGDRLESRGLAFQISLREGFLRLASRFPDEIVVVDGAGEPEDVHRRVVEALAVET